MKSYAIERMKNALHSFHQNEEGDALQTVMIIAVGAMVVAVIVMFGGKIKDWAQSALDKILGKDTI